MIDGRSVGDNEGRFSTEAICAQESNRTSPPGNGENGSIEQLLPLVSGIRPLTRQVVTLAFLSEQLPASLLGEQLARSLCLETEASVALVRFESQESFGSAEGRSRPDAVLNGEFHMPSSLRKSEGGYYSLVLGVGSVPPSAAGIDSLVCQMSRHFRYVLLAAPANDLSASWLAECLVRSDLAYLFLRATTEDARCFETLRRALRARGERGGAQIKPVGCLAKGEPGDDFDLLVRPVTGPMHLFVHGCPAWADAVSATPTTGAAGTFEADVGRLAREICGRWLGLALSSGAAKGFAHIGVIQVLEENGILVDVIAGASMGAYVGSLWAYGNDGPALERLAWEMEERWALWSLIDPVFPPRQGFLRGFAAKRRLMRTIGQARFGDLARPLRIVAGNLATLERVVFSSGEVATAVHASSAVPGICVPVTVDGETYIDGGIVDPLPVDVLREMGVSRIIAVDVIPTPERIRAGLNREAGRGQRRDAGLRKLLRRALPVNQQLNYFARGNLLEILMRSIYAAQIRIAEATCPLADLVLRPAISDDRWLDYRHPRKFIALGREAAEQHLAEIKALVAGKETTHDCELATQPVPTVA